MKNIVLSTVAVLAMSTFAVAGGDIAPVEEPVVVVEPVVTDSGFYLGLGYSLLSTDTQTVAGNVSTDITSDDYSMVMFQAGYKFNSYVALEGRYWMGIDDNSWLAASENVTGEVDAWGIYVKPMYPVTDAFDVYALLGYANTDYSVTGTSIGDLDGFSWGLGASYSFTDSVSVFVDYVNLYNDNYDVINSALQTVEYDDTIATWNFGVTYQF